MADGHEGDGLGASPSDTSAYRVNVHRVNDFVLGHVGQISYRPVAEDDTSAGDLRFSRLDEHREFQYPSLA